jgi:hypothetical protein
VRKDDAFIELEAKPLSATTDVLDALSRDACLVLHDPLVARDHADDRSPAKTRELATHDLDFEKLGHRKSISSIGAPEGC